MIVRHRGYITLLVGDVSKAKEKLSWESKIGLREGIEKTYEWYKENACE